MKLRIGNFSVVMVFVLILLTIGFQESLAQQRRPVGRPAPGRPAARPAPRPATQVRPQARPYPSARPGRYPNGNVRPGSGNQMVGNRRPGNNNININVNYSNNIKIYNQRNTIVRRNIYRPAYSRPPYRWGGYRYHCYRPYYYHPYRPFYWGPRWRPWGFFITTLAATAIIVSFADADLPSSVSPDDYFVFGNDIAVVQPLHAGPSRDYFEPFAPQPNMQQRDGEYYYDDGVFYLKGDEGYTVVAAPLGGIIKSLPEGYETISLDDDGKHINYYYGGAFYEKVSKGYKVVEATAGAVVANLPEGGEEIKVGDIKYVKLGETYYQPVQQDGKNMYEVVAVEEDK